LKIPHSNPSQECFGLTQRETRFAAATQGASSPATAPWVNEDILREEAPLDKINRDFREARRLGANSIRLFLQLGYFMPRYGEMDEKRLEFLDEVILRARKRNLPNAGRDVDFH
jgi:hypothetical protein